MISVRRRWAAGAALVTVGWLASPTAVPVYDGIGAPDEPYRYVSAPEGYQDTAPPTEGSAQSPVVAGLSTAGLTVTSREVGPQITLFIPLGGLAAKGPTVDVKAVPTAPTGAPPGTVADGNSYVISLVDAGGGTVTFTPQAALAQIAMRATTAEQPGPTMYRRDTATAPWVALKTSRGGQDFYVSSLSAAGEYLLAFPPEQDDGGTPLLPLLLLGGVVVLVGVVVAVRLRGSDGDEPANP